MKKSKKRFKGKSGITLVALVVTIVVMLILAGVSLNVILGEQGILNRGKEGVEKYSNHQSNEETMLSETEDWIDEITGAPVKLGKVSVGEKASKNSTINGEDASSNNPIIPKGYVPINTGTSNWGDGTSSPTVENVNNGLVISDNITNGNEWVWVPVSNVNTMYITGTKTLLGTTGETAVTTEGYSNLRQRSGDTYTVTTPGDSSGVREPDLLSAQDTNSSYYNTILGYNSKEEMGRAFVADYKAMIESVGKYKGFYIGRYELTANGEKPGETLTETNWYNLYKACRRITGEVEKGAQSTMIWGCQWDETMSWLKNTVFASDTSKVDSNSTSWGNYKDSVAPANTGNYESGVKKDTGSNDAWKANNIFDLAGNCWEWTQEAYFTRDRVTRGGSYGNSGSDRPASGRLDTDAGDSSGRFRRFSCSTLYKVALSPDSCKNSLADWQNPQQEI